ncbi:MAG: MerR family transcriptional regulator, partial [Oscillospiraceae bacterium]|nr:MerR family transcriptional regulator [Oscillospiraceae bacterium]
AIPQAYLTVGELAKKMGVTIRTLQYYDKEGLLSPSSEREGGRRLYTHKDVIKLFQIQYMKNLGFSLEEIKSRLPNIERPEDIVHVLTAHANEIRGTVTSLKDVLISIEELQTEIEKTETVDWAKYANITIALQAKLMYLKIRRQAHFNQNGGRKT